MSSSNVPAHGCRRFEGKVCVVTASTQGIGFAIAARFATEGGKVVVSSRKPDAVTEAVATIAAMPGASKANLLGVVCHVDKPDHRQALLEKTKSIFGAIDVLVLNAAVSTYAGPTMETPERSYDKLFATNVKSCYLFAKEALPFMARGVFPTKPGAFAPNILLVGSVGGYKPRAPIGIYGVTKTAMLGLMHAMHEDLVPKGIRVNLLAPGVIRTKFASLLVDAIESKDKEDEANAGAIPRAAVGRVGEPDEMGGVAAFICSADGSYVAGESIVAAGGNARL